MAAHEKEGAEFLSGPTCLEYFDRQDKLAVGRPAAMRDTIASMSAIAKISAL